MSWDSEIGSNPLFDETQSSLDLEAQYPGLKRSIRRLDEGDQYCEIHLHLLVCAWLILPWPFLLGVTSKIIATPSLPSMTWRMAEFHRLEQYPEELETFFSNKNLAAVPNLTSAEAAKEQFLDREHLSLISIKCGQFGYGDSYVLLGDSSHTMVHFYGMGMKTGLEDVRIFFEEFIDLAHRIVSPTSFCPTGLTGAYTEYRLPDVQAMTDIAAEHFNELKNGVPPKTEMPRKFLESKLQKHVPALDYKPLYSRIVFGHERFSVAKRKNCIQKTLFI